MKQKRAKYMIYIYLSYITKHFYQIYIYLHRYIQDILNRGYIVKILDYIP